MAGFINKILSAFNLYEDYDDEDEDDFDDYEEEEETPKRNPFRKKARVEEDDEDDDYSAKPARKSSKVIDYNSKKTTRTSSSDVGVCVIRPRTFEDSNEISDTLVSGKAVFLNFEEVDGDTAQRVLDFTIGACYTLRGNLQRVSSYVFIATPANVEISGDLATLASASATSSIQAPMYQQPVSNMSPMSSQTTSSSVSGRYRF